MDKSEKIRLYGQKDYTELIEFPVELVGKDGVIRRYTYEESLLVYSKRIESAFKRHQDRELANAEINHCHKRIEQIHRSWSVVSAKRVESSANQVARYEESAASECRAFIRGYFGRALSERVPTEERPIPIFLSLVHHEGPIKVFHVSLAKRKGAHLLYAFTFDWDADEGQVPAREQYAEWTRILGAAQGAGEDVERLLAAREGKQFGFLLTGSAGGIGHEAIVPGKAGASKAAARMRIQGLLEEDPSNVEAHYALGGLLVKDGEPQAALEQFKTCVEMQPFHLEAYRMLAAIGDSLNLHAELEPYLLQARHYFPDDAGIHWHLGLVWLRLGRPEEALAPASRALELDPADIRTRNLFEALDEARRTGEDPARVLARLERPAPAVPRAAAPEVPGRMAMILVAAGLALSLVTRSAEPMAGTFSVALVLVTAMLYRSRS